MNALYKHFEILEDPRDIRGKKHKLINILIMSIYGILCGYTDFENMEDFLEVHEEYFTQLLGLKNDITSHDTLSRFFSLIDSKKFLNIFISWIKEISNDDEVHVSINGKAIKSARDAINGGNTPYVDDKSNEITVIPQLFELLGIHGKIITIDAIDTQENICNLITNKDKKGEYILKAIK